MPQPKRKHSKSRSAMRRASNMKRPVPNGSPCAKCGEMKLSHIACGACGFYRDRVVIESKEEDAS